MELGWTTGRLLSLMNLKIFGCLCGTRSDSVLVEPCRPWGCDRFNKAVPSYNVSRVSHPSQPINKACFLGFCGSVICNVLDAGYCDVWNRAVDTHKTMTGVSFVFVEFGCGCVVKPRIQHMFNICTDRWRFYTIESREPGWGEGGWLPALTPCEAPVNADASLASVFKNYCRCVRGRLSVCFYRLW